MDIAKSPSRLKSFLLLILMFFAGAMLLTSCQSTDKSQSTINTASISDSLTYEYDASSDETVVRWRTTLSNNTIYDFESFNITFDLYEDGTKLESSTRFYRLGVGHGSSYTGGFNFTYEARVTSAEFVSWTANYKTFWDTYYLWIIITASVAAVFAVAYIIYMIVEDLDMGDLFDEIGDFFSYHPVVVTIVVVLIAGSGTAITAITSHWVPMLIIVGGVLAFLLISSIAHGIKALCQNWGGFSLPRPSFSKSDDFDDELMDLDDAIGDKEAMSQFTVAELKEYCQDNDISGYSGLNKSELIARICAWANGDYDEGEEEKTSRKKPAKREQTPQNSTKNKKTGITFDDIAGLDEAKKAFKEKVVYAFEHKDLYEKYGKKVGGGILLYGLPGTGKTMFAEAASNETDSLFIPIKCSDIKSKWYGESEANVKNIFAKARKAGKAIIFFDEFEAIGAKRTDGGDNGNNDLVPQILAEMQGVGSGNDKSIIVVIAATNKPWSIDSAFLRPGRFDEKIYVPLPDHEARKRMFELKLKGLPQKDLDYDRLSSFAEGFNGADIGAFCDKLKMIAINKSISEGADHIITMEDAEEVRKTIHSSVSPEDVERLKEFEKTGA